MDGNVYIYLIICITSSYVLFYLYMYKIRTDKHTQYTHTHLLITFSHVRLNSLSLSISCLFRIHSVQLLLLERRLFDDALQHSLYNSNELHAITFWKYVNERYRLLGFKRLLDIIRVRCMYHPQYILHILYIGIEAIATIAPAAVAQCMPWIRAYVLRVYKFLYVCRIC